MSETDNLADYRNQREAEYREAPGGLNFENIGNMFQLGGNGGDGSGKLGKILGGFLGFILFS
jgi:hypothetical protein